MVVREVYNNEWLMVDNNELNEIKIKIENLREELNIKLLNCLDKNDKENNEILKLSEDLDKLIVDYLKKYYLV